jgi:hypothetical protein
MSLVGETRWKHIRHTVFRVLGVVLPVAFAITFVVLAHSEGLSGGDAAPSATGSAVEDQMQLKVGDCFQYPSDNDLLVVAPVPCSQPHTAQLYMLNTSVTASCDSSALDQRAVPADAEFVQVTVAQSGNAEVACVVETSPTTGSLMAS